MLYIKKNKNISCNKLIMMHIFALITVFLLSCTDKVPEYEWKNIVVNNSSYNIDFIMYQTFYKNDTIKLLSGNRYEKIEYGTSNFITHYADSVKIVFNKQKYLIYYKDSIVYQDINNPYSTGIIIINDSIPPISMFVLTDEDYQRAEYF